jgi:CBS domain-containing protein
MKVARDVMEPALVVPPDLPIAELARLLLENDADGVCVVEGGALVGVATAMDLVYREKEIAGPTVVAIWDLVLPLGLQKARREAQKVGAADVRGLMTREVVTATGDEPLQHVATRMVDEHLSLVPVLEAGELVGVVSRRSVVAAILRTVAGRSG